MRTKKVVVVGLGYVGLPLACALAQSQKYSVIGYTNNESEARTINRKFPPKRDPYLKSVLASCSISVTADPSRCIPEADIILVCVPTSITKHKKPDFRHVQDALTVVSRYMKSGVHIILESTVSPGFCESIAVTLLEKHRHQAGKSFELSYCPERINPGDPRWNVRNIPRVVGSVTKTGLSEAVRFYQSFIDAEIYPVFPIKAVETVKLLENTFRDVNIALVNEVAQLCDHIGVNVETVINAAATKPFSFLAHRPGCGVGGDCIAADPYYLLSVMNERSIKNTLIAAARNINTYMPRYTRRLLDQGFQAKKIPPSKQHVVVLGLAYKRDTVDIRHSPASAIVRLLQKDNIRHDVYDPYVTPAVASELATIIHQGNAVVLCTDHSQFIQKLTGSFIYACGIQVVIDGRNCLDGEEIRRYGVYYKGIGI